MSATVIPPATVEKLLATHPKGTRHKAKLDIAIPLIGNGMSANAVFQQLRDKFPEASDSELRGVVEWAVSVNPTPTTGIESFRPPSRSVPPKPSRTPQEQSDWWLDGHRLTPEDMVSRSPISIPKDHAEACKLAIGSLYQDQDHLNVVCKFIHDGQKARPTGPGKTLKRDGWLEWISQSGVPQSEAGAWFRLNPCNAVGTGSGGAMTDNDITAFRFVLLESDALPVAVQLALFSRFKLPVAAVVLSGGASVHAWVRIEAPDATDYRAMVARLFDKLKPFGIDPANCNPSRLCRFPGAHRTIGGVDDGMQRLLWLNPSVAPLTDETLKRFEESLEFPCVAEKPMLAIAQNAIARYEWMVANRGKLGVPTGIPKLDDISGGWKRGHTIVIAGATGGGKTTLALHCICAAIEAGIGVALFSLEMDRDEIFDLLMSRRCRIKRDKFNTGGFSEYDIQLIGKQLPSMMDLPLYIEDSSLTSADQIKARTMQLKSDGNIGLVVVDYIQFVNPSLTKDNREQQVAQISHTLRTVARETQIPMIVLSQLNDEGKLRESRVIAHNANIVMTVEIDSDDVKISVVKGRGIPCGEYRMQFDRQFAALIPEKSETLSHPYSDP